MNPSSWPGACDCHMHVYEDVWPLAPTATFKPPHAPAQAYREVQRALGLTRVVVIQPTGYGFDNRCTLAAMQQLGPEVRGVAVLAPDAAEAEFERLHAAGVRGVRYMMLGGGVLPWASLPAMAARIAPRGWHIDLQFDGGDAPLHEALLLQLPCRLVIDHVGKFLRPPAPDSDAFRSLLRVLDAGRAWIKLSAPYETSRSGAPDFEDVAALARALAARHPERCLWASNWPHPNTRPQPVERDLYDWARRCVGAEAAWRRILVDNPAELYGFE